MPNVTVTNKLPISISVKYFYEDKKSASQTILKNDSKPLNKPVLVDSDITVTAQIRTGAVKCAGNDTHLTVNYGIGQNDLALNW